MKILFIIYSDLSQNTGQKIHVKELVENLEKIGNNITLISRKGNFKDIKVSKLYWYDYSINSSFIVKWFYYFFSLILFLFRILTNIKHVDIIYFRNYKLGFIVAIFKSLFRRKAVFEANGLSSAELELGRTGSFVKLMVKIYRFNEKITLTNSDKIISVTKTLKEIFINQYKIKREKIVIVNNGANTDLFRPLNKSILLKEMGFEQDYYYIGFAGSYKPWHDLVYLIDNALYVIKFIPNTKFILIGDGECKLDIIKKVKELNLSNFFIFINSIPYEEVPKYINIFDIGLILKNNNIPGSPLKLWEYMACGVPIIASNSSDFDMLLKYKFGILTNHTNDFNLGKTIVNLLRDNELRNKMGLNARKCLLKFNNWNEISKKIYKAITDEIN